MCASQSVALVSFDEEEGSSGHAHKSHSQPQCTEDGGSDTRLVHRHRWKKEVAISISISA